MYLQIIAFLLSLQTFTHTNPIKESIPLTTADIVFKSTDGGHTWQDVSAGLPKGLPISTVFANGEELILGHEHGLYHSKSTSNKPNWAKEIFLNENILDLYPGKAGPYARSSDKGLLQEAANTDVWIPIFGAMKDETIRTILESNDNTIFIGCNNGIYKSIDGGTSWKQVLASVMVYELLLHDNVLIAGSANGLLRSTDGGNHWESVLKEDGATRLITTIDNKLVAVLFGVGPWNQQDSVKTAENTIRQSMDGGKTWQKIYKNLSQHRYMFKAEEKSSADRFVYGIVQLGKNIFSSTNTGIYRSSDQGKSWELVLPPSDDKMKFFELAVSGNVIFAVNVFGGC